MLRVKSIHLCQKLVQCLLTLIVTAAILCITALTNCIDLVNKNNTRCLSAVPALNKSRTLDAPTPTYISTNAEPLNEKNGTFASPATAFAKSVLPVPGGPTSSAPFGSFAPIRLYIFPDCAGNLQLPAKIPSPHPALLHP